MKIFEELNSMNTCLRKVMGSLCKGWIEVGAKTEERNFSTLSPWSRCERRVVVVGMERRGWI